MQLFTTIWSAKYTIGDDVIQNDALLSVNLKGMTRTNMGIILVMADKNGRNVSFQNNLLLLPGK